MPGRTSRWWGWWLGGIALLVGLAGCAAPPPAPPPAKPVEPPAGVAAPAPGGAPVQTPTPLTEVVLGIPSKSLTFLPAYVGQHAGIHARHGLEVTIVSAAAQTVTAALISGEMQFTAATGSAIRAAAQGIPIKVVIHTIRPPLATFYVREDIHRPEDLKGKVVAVAGHTDTLSIFGKLAVEKLGLDPATDVQWVTTGGQTANNLAAISSGQAQATVLSPPFGAMAQQLGFRKLLGAEDVMPGQPFSGLAVHETLLQANPGLVKRAIRATLETLAWIRENRDAAIAIMRKEFDLDPAVASATYDELVDTYSLDGRAPEEGVRAVIAQNLADTPEQNVPVTQVQDLRLLEEVLGEMRRR